MPQAGPMALEILELQKAVTGAWLPFLFGHNCNTIEQSQHKDILLVTWKRKLSNTPILITDHVPCRTTRPGSSQTLTSQTRMIKWWEHHKKIETQLLKQRKPTLETTIVVRTTYSTSTKRNTRHFEPSSRTWAAQIAPLSPHIAS